MKYLIVRQHEKEAIAYCRPNSNLMAVDVLTVLNSNGYQFWSRLSLVDSVLAY